MGRCSAYTFKGNKAITLASNAGPPPQSSPGVPGEEERKGDPKFWAHIIRPGWLQKWAQALSWFSKTASTSISTRISGIDQPAHFYHRGCRADGTEDFAVGASGFFPFRNFGHIDARPHDIGHFCSHFGQRGFDIFENLSRLSVDVSLADDAALGVGGGGAGDIDEGTDADGP